MSKVPILLLSIVAVGLVILAGTYPGGRALRPDALKKFYDGPGGSLDAMVAPFVENKAWDILFLHSEFEKSDQVLEFGCGDGTLAVRLLRWYMNDTMDHYIGIEMSPPPCLRRTDEPHRPRALRPVEVQCHAVAGRGQPAGGRQHAHRRPSGLCRGG